jgi:hypothetical protein
VNVRLSWLVVVLLAGLTACTPAPVLEEPTLTPEPLIQPTPTETIVWFPPTPTRTLAPTLEVTPTPEFQPVRGAELLVDNFTDEGRWQVGQSTNGSIAYGRSELTLAVRQPKAALTSLRDGPDLSDFYLEVTVNVNLCRGPDMYGLLLRAASPDDYYRLLINCNGDLRLERIMDGRSLPVQDWIQSGVIPSGSPVVLRIGVRAAGREISFFINDIHQFDISDPVIPRGSIGVYARSMGDSALTISFSDLLVTALLPAGENLAVEGTPEAPEGACPLDFYTGRPHCEEK